MSSKAVNHLNIGKQLQEQLTDRRVGHSCTSDFTCHLKVKRKKRKGNK